MRMHTRQTERGAVLRVRLNAKEAVLAGATNIPRDSSCHWQAYPGLSGESLRRRFRGNTIGIRLKLCPPALTTRIGVIVPSPQLPSCKSLRVGFQKSNLEVVMRCQAPAPMLRPEMFDGNYYRQPTQNVLVPEFQTETGDALDRDCSLSFLCSYQRVDNSLTSHRQVTIRI